MKIVCTMAKEAVFPGLFTLVLLQRLTRILIFFISMHEVDVLSYFTGMCCSTVMYRRIFKWRFVWHYQVII